MEIGRDKYTTSELSENAIAVLKKRYLKKNERGEPIEEPIAMFRRVAMNIAEGEFRFKEGEEAQRLYEEFKDKFLQLMLSRRFMPNSPTLMNAGRELQQLSACFVLPVEDSIDGIYDTLKHQAIIHKSGGGCVAGDARVWTTFCGVEPIEVLFNRATIDGRGGTARGCGIAYDVRDLDIHTLSMDPCTGETGLRPVTHVWKFDVEAEHQLVVRTREGTEVQTSDWHPFMVVRGTRLEEVRADELEVGDVILGPERPDETSWPWQDEQVVAGLTIDTDLAWLIGFTLGDGSFGYVPSLRQHRLRWFSGRVDVLDRVREILAKRGIRVSVQRDTRGQGLVLATLAQDFVHAMRRACALEGRGPKDTVIRVPEHIGKSPLPVVRSFVAGLLDSDGGVDADGSPSYTTASEEMAQDLGALLSLLGYRPTVRRKEPCGKGKLPIYTVLMCPLPQVDELAMDIAPFVASTRRRERLQSDSAKQTALALPISPWREVLQSYGLVGTRGRRGAGPCAEELDRWSCNLNGRVNRHDLLRIAECLSSHHLGKKSDLLRRVACSGQEVVAVTRAGTPKPYYDLTVAGWNTYAAGRNGLAMIHNTGFAFSRLRPKNDIVKSTMGVSSGPVSFMAIYDASTDKIKQGGCFIGGTLVATADGPKPIEDLREGDLVYAWEGKYVLAPCTDSWKTKTDAEVWKLTTDKGLEVYATPDHPFLIRHSGPGSKKRYEKLRDLKPGMPLMPLSRYQKGNEWWISLHDGHDTRMPEHVWMARELGLASGHVHHSDGDHTNNVKDNLASLRHSEHAILHGREWYASGDHPFLSLTEEQVAERVEGWKSWYASLPEGEKQRLRDANAERMRDENRRRIEAGTHNLINDSPWNYEEYKLAAKKSRVVRSLWKVMAKGLPVTAEEWSESTKRVGLYNSQRYKVEHIEELFGSFDSALEYANERNHRVVSVEFSHHEDVYNVEVPGPHNFVVCDDDHRGVVVSNTRRGANMGILRVDHPDIEEFILCKKENDKINNFNISVGVSDAFMEAVEKDGDFDLVNPRNGEISKTVRARELLSKIVEGAWLNGEPGVVFIDRVNADNPTPQFPIEATNPCSEAHLPPYDSCNLGSINLERFFIEGRRPGEGEVDWGDLRETVHTAVRFLDNVIEMNNYPLPEIDEMSRGNRRVGLGVMGFADLLIKLGITYDSEEGLRFAEKIMKFIDDEAWEASRNLAEERGLMPHYEGSRHEARGDRVRNATVTTIAPTGTISIIAGCSGGIEPLFAVAFMRRQADMELPDVNPEFIRLARARGFYSEELMQKVAREGSVRGLSEVPEDVRQVWVTSHDISPEWHVQMQAAFQKYTSMGISKTINLPEEATPKDVEDAYRLAYSLGCKAIAVYRDGSREAQVLSTGKTQSPPTLPASPETEIEVKHVSLAEARNGRPRTLSGVTKKLETGHGKMYVTMNDDEFGPRECFVILGKPGGTAAAFSDALGRMISLAMTHGATPAEIVHQLRGIQDGHPAGVGPNAVLSVPDGVARAMGEHYLVEEGPSSEKNLPIIGACPDCSGGLTKQEGCVVCHSCGYSKCS